MYGKVYEFNEFFLKEITLSNNHFYRKRKKSLLMYINIYFKTVDMMVRMFRYWKHLIKWHNSFYLVSSEEIANCMFLETVTTFIYLIKETRIVLSVYIVNMNTKDCTISLCCKHEHRKFLKSITFVLCINIFQAVKGKSVNQQLRHKISLLNDQDQIQATAWTTV